MLEDGSAACFSLAPIVMSHLVQHVAQETLDSDRFRNRLPLPMMSTRVFDMDHFPSLSFSNKRDDLCSWPLGVLVCVKT